MLEEPYWMLRPTDKRGNALDPWQMPLQAYLGLKPPQQREFWTRVHGRNVARAIMRGEEGVQGDGHSDSEIDVWIRHEQFIAGDRVEGWAPALDADQVEEPMPC